MKTALICGVSGQDGAYLAQLLLSKGYVVYGTSRDAQGGNFANLQRVGVYGRVKLLSMALEDFRSVFIAIKAAQPDEVYFLAGQSSVGLSFEQPAETIQSFTIGTLNVLEACRMLDKHVRQYHAGSGECFGDTAGVPANEETPFRPRSPYGVAKASAYWLVNNYREAYGLYACTGVLFNHESPLRPHRFVTQKIIQAAKDIAGGSNKKLVLGRMDISRDWGWAPDYVEAMWLMLQQKTPEDYIIATGHTFSLKAFVEKAFELHQLDWREHVVQDQSLFRPSDILSNGADPRKADQKLNWRASIWGDAVVEAMLNGKVK